MRTVTAIVAIALLAHVALAAVNEPAKPQAGAVVLFDGKDASQWVKRDGKPSQWKVVDGALEVVAGGDILTKDSFDDYTLHLEFRTPEPKPGQSGQDRGNSGVFLADRYEIQVLESHGLEALKDGCGAVYNKKPADKNMAKPPTEWQTYDIVFTAPRFDAGGKKIENARVTVTWNGQKVHDNVEVNGPTSAGRKDEAPGPSQIRLQDHGHPVQYRNIWIVAAKK